MNTPKIEDVTTLALAGARTAEIKHAAGNASVLLREGEALAAGLFHASDEEMKRAIACFKRAALYRAAAWFSIRRNAAPRLIAFQSAENHIAACANLS